MIEDFVRNGNDVLFSMPGIRHLDYAKILKLSDSDFAALYLELMNEYRDKNGWWGKAGIPKCSECNKVIPGPENLRRYVGRSLDSYCFGDVFNKNRHFSDSELEKKYFDRVAKLPYDIKDLIKTTL
jgi:hypothetical protein